MKKTRWATLKRACGMTALVQLIADAKVCVYRCSEYDAGEC